MNIILPQNSAIIVAENEQELKEVFDKITEKNGRFISDLGYIASSKGGQFYIKERENIIIVKYNGVFEFSTEKIIGDFFMDNGFCW